MNRSTILLIDAVISLVLGVVLALFPQPLVEWLGVPPTESTFYPSILGAVVIGIAFALFLEWSRKAAEPVGLGVGGAIAVDLCAAFFLAGWLLVGGLNGPLRGRVFLWLVVAVLVLVSGMGLLCGGRSPDRAP